MLVRFLNIKFWLNFEGQVLLELCKSSSGMILKAKLTIMLLGAAQTPIKIKAKIIIMISGAARTPMNIMAKINTMKIGAARVLMMTITSPITIIRIENGRLLTFMRSRKKGRRGGDTDDGDVVIIIIVIIPYGKLSSISCLMKNTLDQMMAIVEIIIGSLHMRIMKASGAAKPPKTTIT